MPDEVDRLLDEALSGYAAAPERPGLEDRVLARVTRRRTFGRAWFAVASLAAAAVMITLMMSPPRVARSHIPAPAPRTSAAKRQDTQARITPPAPAIRTAVSSGRPSRVRRAEPKRAEFPSPSPLTAQERTLLELGRRQPAMLAGLTRPLEPVNVSPIEIDLLDKGEN